MCVIGWARPHRSKIGAADFFGGMAGNVQTRNSRTIRSAAGTPAQSILATRPP
jgi:hypothetical protein